MEEAAKKTMFWELYQLDEDVSEEEDTSNASQFLKESKLSSNFSKNERATHQAGRGETSRANPSLKHTVSAPLLNSSKAHISQDRLSASQTFPATHLVHPPVRQPIDNSHGLPGPGNGRAAPGVPRFSKRKRGQSFEPRPESQQIFKGLSFCNTY